MSTTKLSMLAVQVPKELAQHLQRMAEENDRTVQGEIRRALRNHVEQEQGRARARAT